MWYNAQGFGFDTKLDVNTLERIEKRIEKAWPFGGNHQSESIAIRVSGVQVSVAILLGHIPGHALEISQHTSVAFPKRVGSSDAQQGAQQYIYLSINSKTSEQHWLCRITLPAN